MANEFLFIDTSAFYAFYDKRDANHNKISKLLQASDAEFTTSNYVLDELITPLRVRNFQLKQIAPFVEALLNESICTILRVDKETDLKAWELMNKYSDHDFSFTDCTSFVLMKKNRIKKVATVDRHFKIAGFEILS